MDSYIQVSKKNAIDAGNCNGCTKHMTEYGKMPHFVWEDHVIWEVSLRGISIRLCRDCRDELIRKLSFERGKDDTRRAT